MTPSSPPRRPPTPPKPVSLIGLRGAGKTTLGRRLAHRLERPFVDLDEELVRFAAGLGHPAAGAGELLLKLGQPGFRAVEAASLRQLLSTATVPARAAAPVVLGTGGGVIERPENRMLLREATFCVWLCVDPEVAAARVIADPTLRPSLLGLDPRAEAVELARRRDPLYAATAHARLECGTGSRPDRAGELDELEGQLLALVEEAGA